MADLFGVTQKDSNTFGRWGQVIEPQQSFPLKNGAATIVVDQNSQVGVCVCVCLRVCLKRKKRRESGRARENESRVGRVIFISAQHTMQTGCGRVRHASVERRTCAGPLCGAAGRSFLSWQVLHRARQRYRTHWHHRCKGSSPLFFFFFFV